MNKTTTLLARDYKQAIEVQNACNLSGVLQTFAEVMPKIVANCTKGTAEWNTHPIAVMYANKIAELTGVGTSDYSGAFGKAYEECKNRERQIPQYYHDCDKCQFVGRWHNFDFYFCDKPADRPTLIARSGDEPSDHVSGLSFAKSPEHMLNRAWKCAQEKGLMPKGVLEPMTFAEVEAQNKAVSEAANCDPGEGNEITLVDCQDYVECQYVCDDTGEPKGQCANCGAKWYEHRVNHLPESERDSAAAIQMERGLKYDAADEEANAEGYIAKLESEVKAAKDAIMVVLLDERMRHQMKYDGKMWKQLRQAVGETRLFDRHSKLGLFIGSYFQTTVAAPGTGEITYVIIAIDEEGVWGAVVENTSRILTPAEVV